MPLHKKGDKASCDNYCGISLIHPLGHLCAKVLEYRLLGDSNATWAISQLGFCTDYHIEDNCVILQTGIELAVHHGTHFFCCFVDLQKAYDKAPRAWLMIVLLEELCIAPENVKFLAQTYTGI